jgi:hypothetical protein
MKAEDLRIGELYFGVGYDDPGYMRPLIITYEYLGHDIHGEPEDPADADQYYFRYLPAFRPEEEIDGVALPIESRFEAIAHAFKEEHLAGLCNLDGLIEELTNLRKRIEEAAGPNTEQAVAADRAEPRSG